MKGLIIKDLYMAKKHCFILFIIFLLFLIMSAATENAMFFSYYSVSLISIVPINIIAYEESYKWNKYEAVLPVSRTQTVLEKYILLLIFILPAVIIFGLLVLFSFNFELADTLSYMCILLFCGIIAPSVIFPVAFKFGYLKAKMIITVLLVVIVSSITIINTRTIMGGGLVREGTFTAQSNSYIFAVFAVIVLAVSMPLSIRFYKKREF